MLLGKSVPMTVDSFQLIEDESLARKIGSSFLISTGWDVNNLKLMGAV
jgi:hypothetical protein